MSSNPMRLPTATAASVCRQRLPDVSCVRASRQETTVISKRIHPGECLNDEQMKETLGKFYRDGFALVPGVLTGDEVGALLEVTDRCFNDPVLVGTDYTSGRGDGFVLRNTLELNPVFVDMLIREPILSLAEAIVGTDCKFCGQNVIRNAPGQAISRWHVDDRVEFPLPDDVPRHDPRVRMPVQWFTIQMALTDIDTEEDGPTQFVPGSHYSGREPNSQEQPEFEGRGPVSALCKAGDIYLQNNQCWHRGGPVTSNRTRYVFQSQYAALWAYRRFSEYNQVPVPPTVLSRASDRLRGVLGV